MDDEDWTEELVEEAESNETRLDEIEATIEARAVYRREDIAIAGCIATVGNDGELKLIQGLVRPEDMPARESGEVDAGGQDDTGDGEETFSGIDAPTFVAPLASPGDAEAEARKEAGVGIGLADDLRAIRTAIVKSQLACDFEAAFDLLLFQLARSVFTTGYHDGALDIRATETPDRPAMRVNDDAFGTINVGEKHLEIDRAAQELDWACLPDAEAFAELRALSEQDKRTLFASCVARTLKGQLAFEPKARPEVEATVARLDIDFAAAVRGNRDQVWTADLLWSRLRKDRILAIARETLGETWAQAKAKQKKADIAKAMEDAFAHGDDVPAGVTAEGRAAAIAWTPPGFRAFDTGTVDDSGAADDPGTTAPEPQPTVADTPSVDALEHSDGGADPSGADSDTSQSGEPEAGATADNDRRSHSGGGTAAHERTRSFRRREHRCSRRGRTPRHRTRLGRERGCHASGRGVRAGSGRRGDHDASASPSRAAVAAARQRPRQQSGAAGDTGLPAPRLNHRVLPSRQRLAGTDQRGVFHSRIDNQENPHVYRTECRYGRARQRFRHDPRPGRRASAIDKVTRLFSAGLADIFTETLQNSRRGGANRVAATIEQDGDTTRVTSSTTAPGSPIPPSC